MNELKRTCRTCKHLHPTTYTEDYYDYEENLTVEWYPCNCNMINDDYDVDGVNSCEHYVPVDENCLCEEV